MATHSNILSLGKSQGQGSLAGYSPWDLKESNTTECVHAHTHTHTQVISYDEMFQIKEKL